MKTQEELKRRKKPTEGALSPCGTGWICLQTGFNRVQFGFIRAQTGIIHVRTGFIGTRIHAFFLIFYVDLLYYPFKIASQRLAL